MTIPEGNVVPPPAPAPITTIPDHASPPAPGGAQVEKGETLVQAELTIPMDFSLISQDLVGFSNQFETNVAMSLGIAADFIKVKSLRSGSIIVEFEIRVPPGTKSETGGKLTAGDLLVELKVQLLNPNSPLRLNPTLAAFLRDAKITKETVLGQEMPAMPAAAPGAAMEPFSIHMGVQGFAAHTANRLSSIGQRLDGLFGGVLKEGPAMEAAIHNYIATERDNIARLKYAAGLANCPVCPGGAGMGLPAPGAGPAAAGPAAGPAAVAPLPPIPAAPPAR